MLLQSVENRFYKIFNPHFCQSNGNEVSSSNTVPSRFPLVVHKRLWYKFNIISKIGSRFFQKKMATEATQFVSNL